MKRVAPIVLGVIAGFAAFFGVAILHYMNDSGLAPVSGTDRGDR
ncbi:MAG: hypothetical protein QG549_645 [Patescibacteria group bacterium]|jgi:hypothetical protein|nr:hypothetical protein [Patescibacteria group bacterium]